MTKNKSGIRSFFASVQLAIVLLSLIAFFALVGTLVPQRETAVAFAERISPALFSFLQKMQIFDLYHSVWFILLSGLLAVNLVICSLDRFPLAWRRFRMKHDPLNEDVFRDVPEKNTFSARTDVGTAADAALTLLQSKYRAVERADGPDGVRFCAEKGRFALFGVYIVHVSILVLIAGAILGSVFGVEGYVHIPEGETAEAISLRSGNAPLPLPFSVRCDKFTVELYESGMPKTFQSDLTFLRDGRPVRTAKLLVNHPVEFEGFRFYQSSYGAAPGGKATLALSREGGARDIMNVSAGYTFALPGKDGMFQVLRVEENLMSMGPAVKVVVRSENEEATFWVFQQIERIREMNPDAIRQVPMFNPGLFRPYTFALLGLEEKYYTGLQVNRDPGTPVVAASALLLIGGLMLILFSYARVVWIRVAPSENQVHVAMAGRSYKNQPGLQKEMQYLLAELKDHLEKRQ
ncbi:MAG TPA: cytochrome c biogenesis protein ResB [Smithellaceae bacterium]|nr:cytochrome c biogenesis protein ResB [Smithellaceae bacterium]HNY95902.1 cytochrome c biogenesis protein ResB [Smithellaceae bacterium]HPV72052.1 cytochrome c biogenesis protein ResB [Smithellaceae bacterium]HPY06918.1 cytochrome c biogenesis protein ResB [Smithellaceae bacterium]HQC10122.1 cytochrome c biogenesis protein ResB [Smithellaceae bacterium]